jgi:hypothetical protein
MDIGAPVDDSRGVVPATNADDETMTRAYQFGVVPIGEFPRAGTFTSAAPRVVTLSRHKSLDVLRGYVRSADLFNDHALGGVL